MSPRDDSQRGRRPNEENERSHDSDNEDSDEENQMLQEQIDQLNQDIHNMNQELELHEDNAMSDELINQFNQGMFRIFLSVTALYIRSCNSDMEPVEDANGQQQPSRLANALEWAQQQPEWPQQMAHYTERYGQYCSQDEITIFVLTKVLELNNLIPNPN